MYNIEDVRELHKDLVYVSTHLGLPFLSFLTTEEKTEIELYEDKGFGVGSLTFKGQTTVGVFIGNCLVCRSTRVLFPDLNEILVDLLRAWGKVP